MTSAKGNYDAVQAMRAVRDKVSADIQGMTAGEEIAWLASRKLNDPFLEKLRRSAARPQDSSRQR